MRERVCASAATLIFVAMMLVVCAEVLLRYGFNSPISWVVEISEYALLWITFLGAAWVLRAAATFGSTSFCNFSRRPRCASAA